MQPKTSLFTSGSQHPPRFGHAVYLGVDASIVLFSRDGKAYFTYIKQEASQNV